MLIDVEGTTMVQEGIVMVKTIMDEANIVSADVTLKCFDAKIEAIELDPGNLRVAVAACSSWVRIFSFEKGTLIYQFQRDFLNAELSSMTFSEGGEWFLMTNKMSDIEIFYTKPLDPKSQKLNILKNRTGFLNGLKGLLPYFGTEYHFAGYKDLQESNGVSIFLDRGKILTVCNNGKVRYTHFDLMNGGTCFENNKSFNYILNK